jgi:hypothetical protein
MEGAKEINNNIAPIIAVVFAPLINNSETFIEKPFVSTGFWPV